MSICLKLLQQMFEQDTIKDIEVLENNTNTSIFVSPSMKQLFSIGVSSYGTAVFTINLVFQTNPTSIGVFVGFYAIDDNITYIGGASITEANISFQKDLLPGNYIICISSVAFSYTGTFKGVFQSTPIWAKLKPNSYTGENVIFDLIPARLPKQCDKVLNFEIIEGELPPGLEMNELGRIEGILPNLDCIEQTKSLSPSQNWYYDVDKKEWHPWSYPFRFKVRVWIEGNLSVIAEQWLSICIHNNWSADRDNFHAPFDKEKITIEKLESPKLLSECCPIAEEEQFIPEPISLDDCEPCLIADIKHSAVEKFKEWYEYVKPDIIIKNTQSDFLKEKENPFVYEFIDKFKKNEYYQNLMKDAEILFDERSFLEIEKDITSKLIKEFNKRINSDGRASNHVDYKMLILKDEQNQTLPTTAVGFVGEFTKVSLTKAS